MTPAQLAAANRAMACITNALDSLRAASNELDVAELLITRDSVDEVARQLRGIQTRTSTNLQYV